MSALHVLVIYKRTTYQRYRGGESKRIRRLIDEGDVTVDRLLEAHEAHLDTLERARKALREHGARAVFRHRHEPQPSDSWDLVVTLGGDGTLLWASHMVGANTPMVAVNSAPEDSVGYFCAGDRHDVEETLARAIAGALPVTELTRMRVDLVGDALSTRVLNDVLFAHECPAATTRYVIELGERVEEHLSSGIWVGPAAGSTAAQSSAGGRVLPLGSPELQFVVREPYHGFGGGSELTCGLVAPDQTLRIRSKIREARVFLDGAQKTRAVDIGAVLTMSRSDEPLSLLGLRRDGDRGVTSGSSGSSGSSASAPGACV